MAGSEQVNEAFGLVLREARDQAGLSQAELARRAGVGRTSITNLEQGHQSVTLDLLFRLADAMNVTPAALLPLRATENDADHLADERIKTLASWDQRFVRSIVDAPTSPRGNERRR